MTSEQLQKLKAWLAVKNNADLLTLLNEVLDEIDARGLKPEAVEFLKGHGRMKK